MRRHKVAEHTIDILKKAREKAERSGKSRGGDGVREMSSLVNRLETWERKKNGKLADIAAANKAAARHAGIGVDESKV